MSNGGKSSYEKRISRAAYRWNTAGGMLYAFQSVILLVVITRACDVQAAGVFTIAWANASLFIYVGKYGMRQFQVSDRDEAFSFADYRASRIATDVAMVVASAAFLAWSAFSNGYSQEKTAVMALVLLLKLVDSSEDVFLGRYQQLGRLDVGARVMTLRIGTTAVVLGGLVAATGGLVAPIAAACAYTAVFYALEVVVVRRRYGMPGGSSAPSARNVARLLAECFPLFASSFLLFYIGNAPKYAIDALMDDAAQAYYGYIAMPSFVVSVLASFLYNPIITSLADQWAEGDAPGFGMRFAKLAGTIAALTAACDLAAFLVGVPVLDVLYNANTAPYLAELVVLVTGGGFLALATLAVLGITIIRRQKVLVPVYAAASVATAVASHWAVAHWGITGASWSYLASMAFLAVAFAAILAHGIAKR